MTSPRFSPKKSSESAKSNSIFHLKRRRDTSWFCNFWIAQWLTFFFKKVFLWFWQSSGRKMGSKLDQIWTSLCKAVSFSKILKALFLLPWILPAIKMLAKSGNIWGSLSPKPPQRRPFHGCWIGTKNFENL